MFFSGFKTTHTHQPHCMSCWNTFIKQMSVHVNTMHTLPNLPTIHTTIRINLGLWDSLTFKHAHKQYQLSLDKYCNKSDIFYSSITTGNFNKEKAGVDCLKDGRKYFTSYKVLVSNQH